MDFIRTFSVTKGLFFENYKVRTGETLKDILQKYNIGDASGSHLSTEGSVNLPLS